MRRRLARHPSGRAAPHRAAMARWRRHGAHGRSGATAWRSARGPGGAACGTVGRPGARPPPWRRCSSGQDRGRLVRAPGPSGHGRECAAPWRAWPSGAASRPWRAVPAVRGPCVSHNGRAQGSRGRDRGSHGRARPGGVACNRPSGCGGRPAHVFPAVSARCVFVSTSLGQRRFGLVCTSSGW